MSLENHSPAIRPDALVRVARGERIRQLMPDAEVVFDRMERQLVNKVFHQIDAGELTPQEARDAWALLYAYRKAFRGLDKASQEAQIAADEISKTVNEEDNDA